MLNPSTATVFAVQEAASQGLHDDSVMEIARDVMLALSPNGFDEDMAKLLFRYSAMLSAAVASRIVNVIYTESEMNAIIAEMDSFGAFDNLE